MWDLPTVLLAIRVLDLPVLRLDLLNPARVRRAPQEPWRYRYPADCHRCSVRETRHHPIRSLASHSFDFL